jgi:hypothetical protein
MAIKDIDIEILTAHIDNVNSDWIRLKGELFNDSTFWNDNIHAEWLDNDRWNSYMDIMELVRLQRPECFILGCQGVFDDVRKRLMLHGHKPRCMDPPGKRADKKLEFKALMNIKDVWNRVNGYEAPTKFAPDPEPEGVFGSLFEIQQ